MCIIEYCLNFSFYDESSLTLFMTIMNGSFVLYSMLHAYSMLDMNVTGLTFLAVSITYTMTVGILDAWGHTTTPITPTGIREDIESNYPFRTYIYIHNPETVATPIRTWNLLFKYGTLTSI